MKVSMRRAVLGVLFGLLALPGAASAQVTSTTISQTTVVPGCQPKGQLAFPAPAAAPAALNGTNVYTVAAIVGGASTTPCVTTSVTNTGASPANSTLIQWNAAPGATAYRIFRNGQALVFNAAPLVTTLTPTQVCPPGGTGVGPRCFFQDSGGPATASVPQPALAAPLTAAGQNADLRIVQRIDYGGDPNTSTDDPTSANDALRSNLLHFPPGLLANPSAAPKCSLSGAAPSLLGSLTLFGSNDPNEDTCPRESMVGTVNALIRTASAPNGSPTAGDVYLGTPLGSETARLFVVLRPSCSAGSAVAPGSASCTAALGSANVEVDKSFLSAKATIRSSDSGIDNDTTSVVSGSDAVLANTSTIRQRSTSPGTPNAVSGTTPIQVRVLTQSLSGRADQNTAATEDDKGFIQLPTSCAAKVLSADITSFGDASTRSASTALQVGNCDLVPFDPKLATSVDVSGGQGVNKGHPAFDAVITQAANEAATKDATVTLPSGLGTDLDRLQTACSQEQLASATGCPEGSRVGSASATTPVLPGQLSGPVFLVASGGQALPKLVVLLDGPLKVRLDGEIAIGARLVNSFKNLPEVTLNTFKLHLDGGANGLLQNTRNICDSLGNADGAFLGYNGKSTAGPVPVNIAGACTYTVPPAYYPIPKAKAKRPKVSVRVTGVKKGRPRLSVVVRRGGSASRNNLKNTKFSMVSGLKFTKRAKKRLVVKAGKKRDRSFTAKGRVFNDKSFPGGKAAKLSIGSKKRALKETRKLRKRGKKAKLRFRFRIKVAGGKTFTVVKKVRPRS